MNSAPILTAAAAVLCATPVFAADGISSGGPASIFKDLGITGTWSTACDKAASPQSPRLTYTTEPDGTVKTTADLGTSGIMTTIITTASTKPGELLISTFTSFDNFRGPLKEMLEKDNKHPDVKTRSVYSTEKKGVLTYKQQYLTLVGLEREIQIIADGVSLNPSTGQPIRKAPDIVKCSE